MRSCNLCGGKDFLPLIDFGDHPVVKDYLSEQSSEQPVWSVNLFFCETCGLTQLVDSCPPEVLYQNYVTVSSWKFQPHVQHEIDVIKGLEGINTGSKIIEIGSNDGMFLHQLSLQGFNQTLGIEPCQDAYDTSVSRGLNTLQAFLSTDLSRKIVKERGQFDMFLSRQNLEHISDLRGVAESIDILLRPGGYVMIEVPNYAGNMAYRDYALWEEHVNYFTADTLRYFLSLAGIEPIYEEVFVFSGESFFVVGRKTDGVSPSLEYIPELRRKNVEYAKYWPVFRDKFAAYLRSLSEAGKKVAIYGAGVRTFCLINFLGVAPLIEVIVDDQVEKQNFFMPGGRLPIEPSESLYTKGIDVCLLAVNTENEEKVIQKHQKWLQGGGRFWSILPPSDRLLPTWY